jgi:hypothetical protein
MVADDAYEPAAKPIVIAASLLQQNENLIDALPRGYRADAFPAERITGPPEE